MLSSITPLGERGRGASWSRTVVAYIFASGATAAAVGALLGTVGRMAPVSTAQAMVVLAVLAGIGIALESKLGGLRLPTVHRQVDNAWLTTYRDWVYGAGFGAQLGAGVGTIVLSSAVYVLLAAEFLTRSPIEGLALGGGF